MHENELANKQTNKKSEKKNRRQESELELRHTLSGHKKTTKKSNRIFLTVDIPFEMHRGLAGCIHEFQFRFETNEKIINL